MKDYEKELNPGLSPVTLTLEASRCLLCHDAPCSKMCPAGTDPAKFIRSVRFRNLDGAAETIRLNNIFGSVCARVCPTEKYCELGCSRSGIDKPIDIGGIQRYVTDYERDTGLMVLPKKNITKKSQIAVIGGGPGGLALAASLLIKGYQVTLYEKENELGGFLRYGIPEYRLPNAIVDEDIKHILDLGLEVKLNTTVGKDISMSIIENTYDAVCVAVGIGKGVILDEFKNNPNVCDAVSYLKEIKENKGKIEVPESAVIIGGGDVAMDISTSLKMLGSKVVTCVYRKDASLMKASLAEIKAARELGVTIVDGFAPVKCEGNEVFFKHYLTESELKIKADKIILAVGQEVNNEGLKELPWVKNEINVENFQVGNSKVFVVGDCSLGAFKTVVGAVKSGKLCAEAMDKFLGGF